MHNSSLEKTSCWLVKLTLFFACISINMFFAEGKEFHEKQIVFPREFGINPDIKCLVCCLRAGAYVSLH